MSQPQSEPSPPAESSWRLIVDQSWNGRSLSAEEHVQIDLRWRQNQLSIKTDSPFHGDPAPIPPSGATPGLWNYEVVELFIAERFSRDPLRYIELEFSPHGHWLAWSFDGIRQQSSAFPIDYRATIEDYRWQGSATIGGESLPKAPWVLLGCAIHGPQESRGYLVSSPLPGDLPDFHQPQHFPPAEESRTVSRPLDEAYRSTSYWVDVVDSTAKIHIGATNPRLDPLLPPGLSPHWSFLTAYNPQSRQLDPSANEKRQHELRGLLEERGLKCLEGHGQPAGSDWEAEPSLLVLGIDPAETLDVARRFGQLAVVMGRRGTRAELVWTTP